MALLIGTSGWQYRDWREGFYPHEVPLSRWLEHYATQFPTVENNGTFYRLASQQTFADWQSRTPEGFVMAIKASRYLTHIRRLRDPEEPVARLLASAAGLGSRLGPVLLQLPPTLHADPAGLAECLRQFTLQSRAVPELDGRQVRVCVEVRHPSWETAEVRQMLEQHNAALCWSDRLGRPLGPLWRTADWGYLRLHEGAAKPWPRYGRQALRSWLDRIAQAWPVDADVFAYFNNDHHAAAPADAAALAALASGRGWHLPRLSAESAEWLAAEAT